jgi:integrase
MRAQPYDGLSLFGKSGNRKYLNAAERRRFLESAQQLPPPERLFCQVLAWSGARISEVLALTPAAIGIESGVASIQTLKRRKRGIVRQVPLPPNVLRELNRVFTLRIAQRDPQLARLRLWRWSRTTAWRYGGRNHWHARNAEGPATWVRGERFSIQRSAAPRSAVARPCLAAHDGNLR